MLISNILNDLYFNVELRDSLLKQRKVIKNLSIKETTSCDSIISNFQKKDELNEEIKKEKDIQLDILSKKLKKEALKNNIQNTIIIISIITLIVILL